MQGVGLLLIYSGGLAVPFLIAGWSIEYFFKAFHRIKHHFRVFEIVSGLILVVVGALLVTDRLTVLNRQFQFMSEWVNVIENAIQ